MTDVIPRSVLLILCLGVALISLVLFWDLKSHDHQKEGWRSNDKIGNLKQWLLRTKTGKLRGSTAVTRMFDKNTKQYAKNIDEMYTVEDGIMGGLTIGHFLGNTPQPNSLMWQWRGDELHHGFLYGRVGSSGLFTGDNIAFIYPDLKTGLRGKFINGELVEATAVEIVAHRIRNGVKELKFKEAEPFNVVWTRDVSNETHIGAHPKITEPHERKSVYVANSKGAKDDGLFACRKFEYGDLVSYYNGIRTTVELMHDEERSDEEDDHVFSHSINSIPEGTVLDVPEGYRSVEAYRTTFGHKVNHKFDDHANVEFDFVDHPVFGVIICLLAIRDIDLDEELFVNYNYNDYAPLWYQLIEENA